MNCHRARHVGHHPWANVFIHCPPLLMKTIPCILLLSGWKDQSGLWKSNRKPSSWGVKCPVLVLPSMPAKVGPWPPHALQNILPLTNNLTSDRHKPFFWSRARCCLLDLPIPQPAESGTHQCFHLRRVPHPLVHLLEDLRSVSTASLNVVINRLTQAKLDPNPISHSSSSPPLPRRRLVDIVLSVQVRPPHVHD